MSGRKLRSPRPVQGSMVRTAKTSTMKSALTTRHSAAVVPGAPTPRMNETSAATAAAPRSSNVSAPCHRAQSSCQVPVGDV